MTDSGNHKGYYHEIPNMADDDLDVYSYRLYGHFRRVIGNNGEYCEDSIRELAKICQMSVGKASSARRDLESRGLVRIETVPGPGGSIAGSRVYLVDVWAENKARYKRDMPETRPADGDGDAVAAREHPRSPHEHPRSYREHGCSPGERSLNNYIKQKPDQKPSTHHQSDSKSPQNRARGDDEKKAWGLVFDQVRDWNLLPYARSMLQEHEPAAALALIWLAGGQATRNPAGYLARMLMQQQVPSADQEETAALALTMGTGDRHEAARQVQKRKWAEQNTRYGFG